MKKAIVYGAGNIGRGFIGQLFSRSGYEVVFVDVDKAIVGALNAARRYPVDTITASGIAETVVDGVRAVDGSDFQAVAAEFAGAGVMATAVGVNVLPHIAKPIAMGFRARWNAGEMRPLNIIVCENIIHANRHLENLIKRELDAAEASLFDLTAGLAEASIGRMVPVMTDEMRRGNILRIRVEEYGELPVDKDAFKGEIPAIEKMTPFSPFEFHIHRKLFIHNLGHAMTAYLGFQKGYRFIWEAIRDPHIKLMAIQAMLESAMALSLEHGVHPLSIIEHINNLIARFGNRGLEDTVERVGRDPLRKLSCDDRLAGAARLCGKHDIPPVAICAGIAAGMRFTVPDDPSSSRLAAMIAQAGVGRVMGDLCGIAPGSKSFATIMGFHALFARGAPLESVVDEMELGRERETAAHRKRETAYAFLPAGTVPAGRSGRAILTH